MWDFLRLLRRRGKAKRKEHSEKSKTKDVGSTITCFHLITLSALTSTFGGIVRPICFAAFRLMMNSNFFGCSTGSSSGLVPLRILSTYTAARRNKSVLL